MPLTRDDWIRAALTAIAAGGADAVAVEPLAQRLGATKGSFYWHFAGREELVRAALSVWEREATDRLVADLGSVPDPRERLRLLFAAAMDGDEGDAAVDAALLAVGDGGPVAEVVARVHAKRLRFLVACFRDMGLPRARARTRGRLAYSLYLGWFRQNQGASRAPTRRELAEYRADAVALLTAG